MVSKYQSLFETSRGRDDFIKKAIKKFKINRKNAVKQYYLLNKKSSKKPVRKTKPKKSSKAGAGMGKLFSSRKAKPKATPKKKKDKPGVLIPLDGQGYISIALEKTTYKGIKLTFVRREGRKKRTVALKIDRL